MKIGVMCHSGCGGSARIALEKSNELARRGHIVHVFTDMAPFFQVSCLPNLKLHCIHDSAVSRSNPYLLRKEWSCDEMECIERQAADVICTGGLDILHIHYAIPFVHIAAKLQKRFQGASPVMIATLHGTDVTACTSKGAAQELVGALKQMDFLTTVSDAHAKLASFTLRLNEKPLVIPNFVDTQRFQPANRRRPRPVPIIAHLSNFRAVKNPTDIAAIFLQICRRKEVKLWLVGGRTETELVRDCIESAGFTGDIQCFSNVNESADLLAQADLLIMASAYESFCLAALESMACGVPVIATKVGGLPEVVIHERTGFLYNPGETEMAAEYASSLSRQRRPLQFHQQKCAGAGAPVRATERCRYLRSILQLESTW